MGDSPAPYNPELLTTVTFTPPPPSLSLGERTKKAIAEFDVILESYLDECYCCEKLTKNANFAGAGYRGFGSNNERSSI
jgi:hypothetical protein